jgi:UPF0755 protein
MPGMKALLAAMHPDNSELLYFVAKGDGSHYFSSTLTEHNKAVKDYQLTPVPTIYQLGNGLGLTRNE